MKPRYDVVTIGAGPAGCVAAYAAARRGLDVLLLDRATFPRFKVCGCCLNARVLATFERLGLGGLPAELGARPLSALNIHAPGRRLTVALPGSVGLSRSRLDTALAERAQSAGAVFADGVRACVGPVEGTSRRVRLETRSGGTTNVRARVVVVADGLSGTALKRQPGFETIVARDSRWGVGTLMPDAPRAYRDGEVILASGAGGYVGTVRLEDRSLDVAAALDRAHVLAAGGPGQAAAQLLAAAGLPPIPGLAAADWRGTPALTRRRRAVAGERLFVVGDAAGYVEPFTGEGIAWAVEGAEAISEILAASQDWDGSHARVWTRRHRTLVRRQWGCRAVAAVLRRPRLVRTAIALLGRSPQIAAPLVRRLTQPLSG